MSCDRSSCAASGTSTARRVKKPPKKGKKWKKGNRKSRRNANIFLALGRHSARPLSSFFYSPRYSGRSCAQPSNIRPATRWSPTGSSTTCSLSWSPLRSRPTKKKYSRAFAVDLTVLLATGAPLLAAGNHGVLFVSSAPPPSRSLPVPSFLRFFSFSFERLHMIPRDNPPPIGWGESLSLRGLKGCLFPGLRQIYIFFSLLRASLAG